MSTTTATPVTTVITGTGRLSYAKVWKPEAGEDGGELKYSTSFLIPKTDKVTLKAIEAAIEAAKEKGKEKKWQGKIPAKLKICLKDGDEEKPEDEAYAGMMFMSAYNKNKPVILDRARKVITDETEVYSGCYAKLLLNFYPYANKSNGVSASLEGIMKIKDGDAFSGRLNVESAFAEVALEDEDDDFLG